MFPLALFFNSCRTPFGMRVKKGAEQADAEACVRGQTCPPRPSSQPTAVWQPTPLIVLCGGCAMRTRSLVVLGRSDMAYCDISILNDSHASSISLPSHSHPSASTLPLPNHEAQCGLNIECESQIEACAVAPDRAGAQLSLDIDLSTCFKLSFLHSSTLSPLHSATPLTASASASLRESGTMGIDGHACAHGHAFCASTIYIYNVTGLHVHNAMHLRGRGRDRRLSTMASHLGHPWMNGWMDGYTRYGSDGSRSWRSKQMLITEYRVLAA
ncbi:hypothetical protein C8Q74DRAFT_867868 [Fomes fomentarius]|nr:hypothetical protein C8Q74DRAFT_867868 [Fomes fomentarius]